MKKLTFVILFSLLIIGLLSIAASSATITDVYVTDTQNATVLIKGNTENTTQIENTSICVVKPGVIFTPETFGNLLDTDFVFTDVVGSKNDGSYEKQFPMGSLPGSGSVYKVHTINESGTLAVKELLFYTKAEIDSFLSTVDATKAALKTNVETYAQSIGLNGNNLDISVFGIGYIDMFVENLWKIKSLGSITMENLFDVYNKSSVEMQFLKEIKGVTLLQQIKTVMDKTEYDHVLAQSYTGLILDTTGYNALGQNSAYQTAVLDTVKSLRTGFNSSKDFVTTFNSAVATQTIAKNEAEQQVGGSGGVVVPGVGDIVNPELHPLIKINSIKKTEFSYIFEINSEVTKTSQLVIALYNDLRQLTSLRVFRNELGTKAYNINYTEDSTQYKIMLIDSLSNITPICGCLHSEFTQDNVTVSAEKYHRLGKVQVKETDGYDISVITDYYNYGSEYEFIYEDYVAVKDCKNIDTLINAKEGSLFSFAANNKDEIIAVNLISDEEYSLYVTDVVVDIYANNTRIALENHGLIDLEYAINGEEGYSYKIYYAGQEIDVTDLKIGDVISYTTDSSGKNYTIFVSRELISGTIEEMYMGAETLLVIAGVEYQVAKGCYIGSRKAGDSGRFYLDVFGCVAKYKEPKVIHNYGFIVAMGEYQSVGDTAYEVKILAKDGTMITYELADQVTTNVTDDYNGDGVTGDCRFLYFNNLESKDTIYNWALSEFGQLNDRPDFSLATTTTETNLTNYAKRMVSFKVNSDGKISTMIFANYDYDLSELVYDVPNTRAVYSQSTNSIGNRFLTDDTVIFHLPMCDGVISDDFEILDALEDGEEYKMIALDVDADTNEVGALIIAGKNDTDKTGDNIAIFIRSALVQNDIVKVIFLQGGEEKVIYANGDTAGTVDFASLVKGSLFSYQADENNIIKQADLVLDVTMYSDLWNNTTYTGPKSLKSYDDATWANISQNSLVAYDFGYVTDKRNGNVFTLEKANDWSNYYGFLGVNAKQIAIPEDATITIVDLTKALTSTSRVVIGHYSDIQATKTANISYDDCRIADRDLDFSVFVNYYNSDIIDIVAIKGAAEYFGIPIAY